MEKELALKYIDSIGREYPFPSAENQIVIHEFSYSAQRMGGAPRITASIMLNSCYDHKWKENGLLFADFNGERFFLEGTPSGKKDNDDARYKHDLTFVSERVVLENVYFYDVLYPDMNHSCFSTGEWRGEYPFLYREKWKDVSAVKRGINDSDVIGDSTDIYFFGDVNADIKKLNSSLIYSNLRYYVQNAQNLESEEKQITLKDVTLASAIQEIQKTFKIPYYFEGRTVRLGEKPQSEAFKNVVFKYGADNNLMSVSKENSNAKIINKISAVGSSENIPYYYPNEFPQGELLPVCTKGIKVNVVDNHKFNTKARLSDVFTLKRNLVKRLSNSTVGRYGSWIGGHTQSVFSIEFGMRKNRTYVVSGYYPKDQIVKSCSIHILAFDEDSYSVLNETINWDRSSGILNFSKEILADKSNCHCIIEYKQEISYETSQNIPICYIDIRVDEPEWMNGKKKVFLSDYGLQIDGMLPMSGTISVTQREGTYVQPCGTLMPRIYRESLGKEKFYRAEDNKYKKEDGSYYLFENVYNDAFPREHIETFDDVKPSIKNVRNKDDFPIDEILEIAFDEKDNNEKIESKEGLEYVHPLFFVKLRKTDGNKPFNLFDCAIEGQSMKLHFTSGHCAGHTFEIAVDKNNHKDNLVQTTESGDLLKDGNGDIICGRDGKPSVSKQDWQQDTSKREVWIALRKDNTSNEGQVMPDSKHGLIPAVLRDKFVLTDIKLPRQYIEDAEIELEKRAIEFMSKNNGEKFSFSVNISRIFLANHKEILDELDENSRITIEYNNLPYVLYVSSYSYKVDKDEILPDIRIDLKDNVEYVQSSIQRAIVEASRQVLVEYKPKSEESLDANAKRIFLSKENDDIANNTIVFQKTQKFSEGLEVGEFRENGSGIRLGKDGTAEVQNLKVRGSISTAEYSVNKIRTVNGDLVVTEGDTIEKVEPIMDGSGETNRFYLHLRSPWEGYVTSQRENNIIRGILNTASSGNLQYYTSWMLVQFVNYTKNILTVIMYPDADVPGGKNYPPCEMMNVARYGNAADKDFGKSIQISSTDGRIIKMANVNKPITDEKNIGFVVGELPKYLKDTIKNMKEKAQEGVEPKPEPPKNPDGTNPEKEEDKISEDYIYARGIFFQDLVQVDYEGVPYITPTDRGEWVNGEKYYSQGFNEKESRFETSDVWHKGCKYRCAKNLTETEPSLKTTDWAMVEGDPTFKVDFVETDLVFDPDRFNLRLSIVATLHNQDVTDLLTDNDVSWERYSEDADGNPRTAEDLAWAQAHKDAGKFIDLTKEDCGFNGYVPKKLRFTAVANWVRDDVTTVDKANFEY